MTITFGVFYKIEGSDRYALTQLITSPYETESTTDEVMVKDISFFEKGVIDTEEIAGLDIALTALLSFGVDGSVALHPDITSVEIIEGMVADPADGKNEVVITMADNSYSTSFSSVLGSYLRTAYPTGYETPDACPTPATRQAATTTRRRARNADGTYRGDDPSTPDINEAWEGG